MTYKLNDVAISHSSFRALRQAANREHGNVCPMSPKANAQTVLLESLERKGLIVDADKSPFITDKGRD